MRRAELLPRAIAVAWGALIAATLTSWWVGSDHAVGDARTGGVVVLLVAFFKVRLVGLYFMELRTAPLVLRALFEGWCVVVCAVIVTMFVLE